ncbi:MAG TPA: hypothetical protein VMC10_04315 [Stellaceae bacterium]|nr:hypothetical protein [Stellaceae bacterium]
MTDVAPPDPAARRRLGIDGWAVLSALALAVLVWADLLPAIRW